MNPKQITCMRILKNGTISRFTFNKRTLYYFLLFLILFFIVFAFLIYSLSLLFLENRMLKTEILEQEQYIVTLEAEKKRVENYQLYLEQTNPDTLALIFNENKELTPEQEDQEVDSLENIMSTGTSTDVLTDASEDKEQSQSLEATSEAHSIVEEPVALENNSETTENILFNKGLVKIENFKVDFTSSQNRIDLTFDLYNTKKQNSLEGNCIFTLIKSEENTEIPLIKRKPTPFLISNLKEMETTLVPEKGSIKKADTLKMEIFVDEALSYTYIYPLSN